MAWSPMPSQPAMTVRSTMTGRAVPRSGAFSCAPKRRQRTRNARTGCSPTLTGAGPPALPVAGPASRPASAKARNTSPWHWPAPDAWHSTTITGPARSAVPGEAGRRIRHWRTGKPAPRSRDATARANSPHTAAALSSQLAAEWPGVASALATSASDPRLIWMVRAAEDLTQGRSHDGARAFVQAHAASTKAREDLPHLLAEAGFEPDALTQLGISRNPYVGLGGPVRAHLAGRTLDFSGWPGPRRHPAARRPAN